MGCTTSLGVAVAPSRQKALLTSPKNGGAPSGPPSGADTFTGDQRRVLRRTWRHLADDLTGRGSKVFLTIFELYPHVKALFPCGHCQGEELLRNPNFKGHASRFMQAVGAVVDNIHDPDDVVTPLLVGLGRQHVHYPGFKAEYFQAFKEGMVRVWAAELGARYTPEVSEAWLVVFAYIMSKLELGYELALSESRPGSGVPG